MIDATLCIPLDADLDAVLAIADAERLALCDDCGSFVPEAEAAVVRGWCLCGACQRAQAEIDAELDAIHDAAERERAAGIDPQLSYHMARHDRRR